MSRVVVDTHVAVWSLIDRSLLSVPATAILVAADAMGEIIISAITLIELTYLTEKGRLAPDVLSTVQSAIDDPTTAFKFCWDRPRNRRCRLTGSADNSAGHARPHNRGHCSRAWVAVGHT